MKHNLTTTNQNAKLALSKSKSLLNITNSLLSKEIKQVEKRFKFRPFLIEEGHSKAINSLVVTSDSKTIISGSDDNTIKLWDIETGECLKTLKGHSGRIHSLAITLDGKQIISGSLMETKIWDLQSGKCLKNIIQKQYATIFTNDDYITSFQVISSDGNTIASVNYYEEVRVWNQEDFSFISKFYTNVGTSPRLAISPDGNIVAVGKGSTSDRCGKIEIWDIKKNQCIHKLNKHTNLVSVLVITPDNKLVSGSWDETIRVWDIESGKCLKVLEGQKSFVYALAVTPDGNTLVSSSSNPNIKIWDLSTGKCLNTIESTPNTTLAITPDGKNIVTGYGIWSLETGQLIKKLKSSRSMYKKILATKIKEKEPILIKDEHVKFREINLYDNKSNYLKTLKKQDCWIQTLTLAHIIRQIADENSFFNDFIGIYSVKLWDTQNDRCILTVDIENDIAIDSQGYFNASDESIDKWIRISESPLQQRKLTKEEISYFKKETNDHDIEDLCKYRQEERNETAIIEDNNNSVSYYIEPILITPDRKTLVTAHHDNTLKIWDIQTGKCLKSLEGHTGFPKTIAITPDGQTIITSIIRDDLVTLNRT
ncbi:WD40 repeat domain-containing protein [Aliarcobacter cryaerophilus]|uniref:WD40 repeat domain-containing protein n=1 Tax=Aliarcobacter cryaerophilus TaxID=28198 RepID=UPI003DA4DC12